ncbi:Xaa-Pro dipeptidyl-peptidase [Streptomyces sp. J2-1]|uniref:Xaa-Pro dipeptidyl-peptidase n=1 Tax=Streptomyces corallincola TaxID=2851888 RepID=UPI001C3814D3|nr:Xaa-Pro dipeptidyl-peptidase [Streptomyces corallincola]MBV2355327.1 Xaa-Pro dipeptidyl-peptidase [Streptomyces corallincola]
MPKRTPTRTRSAGLAAFVAAAVAALLAGLLAPAAQAAPRESRPVYSYADAVRESVWVDTGLDLDRDGRTDRVAADVVRPAEPARAGRRVPVIMDASPYYSCCGRGNESQLKTYDDQGRIARLPLFYDNFFVPRGYAVVGVDLAGTNRSDDCVDVGGPSDITSAKAVIDWLNGRATAYTSRTGTTTVRADWSDGRTGMIGKSWDATIANGVAATGVRGLRTIVPISGISAWYDYYVAQGAEMRDDGPDRLSDYVQSADARARCTAVRKALTDGTPRTGDLTPTWTERDYVKDAAKVRASVFLVHGTQDLNVRAKNVGQWWDALARNGVHRKIWLSQTGHVDPFDYRRGAWVDTLHRWFDHELLGYDNGIDREPMADVERAPDRWATSAVWPPAGTAATTLHPAPGRTAGVGTLAVRPATGTATFTDDPARGESDWAAHAAEPTPEKAAFLTPPLGGDLRLSGSSRVSVTVTPSTASARLSAVLVDLGPATIRDYTDDGEGITTLTDRTCWGASTPADSACFLETAAKTADVGSTVFSRGWADLGHHASLTHGEPLVPGRAYTTTLELATSDHVVPKGHRLALIVAGTDRGLILPASTRPALTLDLARTTATLPLVGGADAFRAAVTGRGGAVRAPHGTAGLRVPDVTGVRVP